MRLQAHNKVRQTLKASFEWRSNNKAGGNYNSRNIFFVKIMISRSQHS